MTAPSPGGHPLADDAPSPGGYLLIDTRAGEPSDRFLRDAVRLAGSGSPVSLFLVADAVTTAVRGASHALAEFVLAGGRVWVDEFTLAQRALPPRVLADGVYVAGMDRVAGTLLADGVRTVWH